jgi:hypothetical protein
VSECFISSTRARAAWAPLTVRAWVGSCPTRAKASSLLIGADCTHGLPDARCLCHQKHACQGYTSCPCSMITPYSIDTYRQCHASHTVVMPHLGPAPRYVAVGDISSSQSQWLAYAGNLANETEKPCVKGFGVPLREPTCIMLASSCSEHHNQARPLSDPCTAMDQN